MLFFINLTLKRGLTTLLENTNATINPGQKVGLVGKNGYGKSSLFALLKNEMSAEGGEVSFPPNWALAWVNQETPSLDCRAIDYVIQGDREYSRLQQALQQANTANDGNAIAALHNQLDAIDAWTIEARAGELLHGLGFTQAELEQPVKAFSGGWRMRLNLAQALICRSDLLLLDEPTNHLDLDAVIWLERWLKQYPGTLILISHDRDFLDPIVGKILHIEQQKLNEYTGDYSSFEQQRATKLAQQNAMYRQQQLKIDHLQRYIDRFKAKATKAKQAQSRIKALERMEKIAPAYVDNPFHFEFREPLSLPNPLLMMENASVGYGEGEKSAVEILSKIKLNLVPGSRIGLLGKNGAGKSTLIKLLAGEIAPTGGTIQLAKGVQLGYFAQHQLDTLRADESALWHLQKIAPQQTEQQLRDYLGGFAFHGDKVNQPAASFSGGEKARLVLALIVWQRPNLLLLDEPTNHLDLDMRQALTEALVDYQGSLVLVSHDRHLLRNTVDEFYLVHDKQVEEFKGDLGDYQKWLNEQNAQPTITKAQTAPVENENSAANRKEQKRKEAELRQQLAPLRKQATQLENQMEKLGAQLQHIETALADPKVYDAEMKAKLTALLNDQVQTKKQLEEVEAAWLVLQEDMENITAQA
ncbi:ABC transporter ATP-binding protein [Aggregatibacter actinomycetemcomitans]|uniref:ABC transporter ATP-binding protein n=2 Tax=Aggregatibacter actinomycetemcomitans TaxID=714 RepID=UPI00022AB916|nr:ABC transporter ATP-binding protein [Aggregatibacter actinomycetemcomitans]ANU81496.1 ABC transporter ATP-binding protein [Aggregatibacter actinomycetemcomitans]KOE66962.1 ABC transporter ATP-binding protein [Aggregatibacter actinomycetemcomitans serotype d str. I63B]KYK84194.1 ABC transporter ATP-binding protein [Aggregatibacter actinomycetemcomitans serotype d str. SA3033]KYK88610.1 ABC transporter ATP-binding protein [Aggregatibacter actinomycetemcomitans serotype d str. SA508]KYK92961.1